jgi:hypothetical protein
VPVAACWVEHPGFGSPFVDEHCIVYSGAATVITDADNPGVLARDARASWPLVPAADDGEVDLRQVPAPHSGRASFAALTDFANGGWAAISSPRAGFGIGMAWDATLLPHAWWWQECHATDDYPWFRRAYVIAVEPANVLPGMGATSTGRRRGEPPTLAGNAEWSSTVTLVRYASAAEVTHIDLIGNISFAQTEGQGRHG